MMVDVQKLSKIDMFGDLTEIELSALAGLMTPVEYPADHVIMKEGDRGDTMYVLVAGRIQVSKALTMKFGRDDYRDTDKTLSIFKEEDHILFGEMALITAMPRTATVSTQTPCVVYEIGRDAFLGLAREMPDLGFKITFRLARLLCQRLEQASDDIVRLTTALSIALSPI